MADKLDILIDRIKTEGQLTRNRGTNQICQGNYCASIEKFSSEY